VVPFLAVIYVFSTLTTCPVFGVQLTEAELSELISTVSFDIQADGVVNNTNTISQIFNTIENLNPIEIRQNLENRYQALGIDATIPNFEEYLPDTLSISANITYQD